MTKHNVYLVQVNNTFGNSAFLPYSVGLLQAYAMKNPIIRSEYDFKGFVFLREPINDVIVKMDNPNVVGISCYIWNFSYSMALAKAVKGVYPGCLIVLGGPHVPVRSENFFKEYPYVDLLIHYEGEVTFEEVLLERLMPHPDFTMVAGLSVNQELQSVKTKKRERLENLGQVPSPYLSGVFDELMKLPYSFHPTQETHRGCPYACSFCDWGSNVFAKVKKFDDGRLEEEFDWFANHGIDLLYNCVSEGTEIIASRGRVPIEQVKSGDLVLGFDEDRNKLVWNKVLDIKCSGEKDVLELNYGNGVIEATGEHFILTGRGWIRIDEVNIFDQVMSYLPEVDNGKQESMFQDLQWGDFWRDDEEVWEKSRRGGLKNQSSERSSLERTLSSCPQDGFWREQLYEEHVSGTETCSCYEWSKNLSKVRVFLEQREDKGYQNGRGKENLVGENAKVLVRSCLGKNTFREGWKKPKWVGEKNTRIFEKEQPSFHFYGKLQFLDWPMYFWEMQKSRLCKNLDWLEEMERNSESKEKSCVGSWDLLAQFRGKNKRGNRRLRKSWLESIHNLGSRKTGSDNGGKNKKVCWVRIKSVKNVGKRKVYDIVNAIPTHNFFANGILVSNCDANYGMFERDIELTRKMAHRKTLYGSPNKFRAAYAKNSNDRVFEIAKILHKAGMNKGVTLSFQSMNDPTLEAVKRKNIKMENFRDLIRKYRQEEIATYTELIIGLPGETYETFVNGIDALLDSGQHGSLSVYTCEILPNSEMSDPDYMKRFGIKTVKTPVLHFHASPSNDPYQEWYELVVSTDTLPPNDWLKCQMFAWIVQAFHCMGLTQKVAIFLRNRYNVSYRRFYEGLLEKMTDPGNDLLFLQTIWWDALSHFILLRSGGEWGWYDSRFGNIFWPLEEGAFLECTVGSGAFYSDMKKYAKMLVPPEDDQIVWELFHYQENIVKAPYRNEVTWISLRNNFHDYIEKVSVGEKVELEQGGFLYKIIADKTWTDLKEFAKDVPWYGRKGGSFFNKVEIIGN